MQTLPKGANAPLPPGPVSVRVAASAPVDVSALLLAGDGKVRGDADFVFYNQPEAPGVRYLADGVDIDPSAVDAAIEQVTVTASLDGRGPATFGALGGLRLDVTVAGERVAEFVPEGLGAETALLCVDVYRRNGQWKVRAVGQGYAEGLGGIATDFGVTVEGLADDGASGDQPTVANAVPLPPADLSHDQPTVGQPVWQGTPPPPPPAHPGWPAPAPAPQQPAPQQPAPQQPAPQQPAAAAPTWPPQPPNPQQPLAPQTPQQWNPAPPGQQPQWPQPHPQPHPHPPHQAYPQNHPQPHPQAPPQQWPAPAPQQPWQGGQQAPPPPAPPGQWPAPQGWAPQPPPQPAPPEWWNQMPPHQQPTQQPLPQQAWPAPPQPGAWPPPPAQQPPPPVPQNLAPTPPPMPAAPDPWPDPAASAAPPAPPAAAQPVSLEKVTLDKPGRVSLAKRQTVSLTKGGAPVLRRVVMGLGWDPADTGRSVDLDASAIVIGANGKKVDSAWFLSQTACGGAIKHSGDNLTGHGEGDDEQITVDLNALAPDVAAVVFVVNSFGGQKFTAVARASCRLVDLDTGAEIARFDLTESQARTGVVMSVLRRFGASWEMTAIGEFHDGRTVRSMYGTAEGVVRGLG
ncbi:TerD family protein [Actinomycetes bacterium KLBMP 9759]